MKRVLIFILMTVCILGMSGCGSKDATPKESDSVSNSGQMQIPVILTRKKIGLNKMLLLCFPMY